MANQYLLNTTYHHCTGINTTQSAEHLVRIIQEIGGVFLSVSRKYIKPNPISQSSDAPLFFFWFEHPILERDAKTNVDRVWGSASLYYRSAQSEISLNQSIEGIEDQATIDAIARGQLELARLLIPYLQPIYGWIDMLGRNLPSDKDIADRKMKTIPWTTMFGPPWVETLGKNFLLDAPGWQHEAVTEDTILYTVSSRLTNKEQEVPGKAIRSYFRKKFPRIELYVPKPLRDM